jgi:hypothetical protein
MLSIKERYSVDGKDKRIGVLLDMEDYRIILEELEELETIRAYNDVRAFGEKGIPFEHGVADIEQQQKK